jgi:hypothetical protein
MSLGQDVFVEVLEVSPQPLPADVLWGFNIDEPLVGDVSDSDKLLVKGWVLAKNSKVEEVQVLNGKSLVQTIPVDQTRLDVIANFPDASTEPGTAGFSSCLAPSKLELTELQLFDGEGEIALGAVLSNGTKVDLGKIRIRRKLSHTEYLAGLESKVNEDIERSKLLVQSSREKLEASKMRLQKLKEGL